ncbi:MAG: DUF192 domain-containing protein [Candidatus Saccharimonadales bacterium]
MVEKKYYILIAAIILAAIIGWLTWVLPLNQSNNVSDVSLVEFDSVTVEVEIADTAESRSQGLSGRESLSDKEGMLFVFDQPGIHGFHMLDMNFAIDIIWIDSNLEVVDITHNLLPASYPEVITSPEPVKYVLEVNAGFTNQHDISVGDSLKLTL